MKPIKECSIDKPEEVLSSVESLRDVEGLLVLKMNRLGLINAAGIGNVIK